MQQHGAARSYRPTRTRLVVVRVVLPFETRVVATMWFPVQRTVVQDLIATLFIFSPPFGAPFTDFRGGNKKNYLKLFYTKMQDNATKNISAMAARSGKDAQPAEEQSA